MSNLVPGYGLEAPSCELVRTSLARYVDDHEVEELWRSACATAGFAEPHVPTSPQELLLVVNALETLDELAAVCAKGLRIRIMAYLVLSRSGQPDASGTPTGV